MTTSASLPELAAAGIRFHPAEAVTLVREICRLYAEGSLPGIPSPAIVRLSSDGGLLIQGPVIDEGPVARAAHLLEALLCDADAPAEYRPGGALRLVIARALRTIDLPPFPSVADFGSALARFSTLAVRETVIEIMEAWQVAGQVEASAVAPRAGLTISDIRRARRATGMTLDEIAVAAGVTPSQIRYLEWGCPRGWRADAAGRAALVRYAHAAGLDDAVVTSVAWPLIEAGTPLATDPEPAPAIAEPVQAVGLLPPDRRTSWFAVPIAAAALLVSAAAGYVWGYLHVMPPAHPLERHAVAQVRPAATRTSQTVESGNERMIQPLAYSPAFASSGSVVYFHQQAGTTSALKRGETDAGGALVGITSLVDDRSRNYHPRPSPDGSLIAFDSDRDGVRRVFVAHADGTDARPISGSGFASVPNWSPDGRRIVFVKAEPESPRVWNLWVAGRDGSGLRRLTHHRVGQAWGGSWFPDGRRLAYSVETELVILDLTTGAARRIASPSPGHLVRTPAVSPDGQRIIFQVHGDGAWLLNVGTGAMRRVLADRSAEEFSWAPDGRTVAFHSHRTGVWSVWSLTL